MKRHIKTLACLAATLLTGCGSHPQGSTAAPSGAPASAASGGIAPNSKEQQIIQARQKQATQNQSTTAQPASAR